MVNVLSTITRAPCRCPSSITAGASITRVRGFVTASKYTTRGRTRRIASSRRSRSAKLVTVLGVPRAGKTPSTNVVTLP